ncbi:MAG: pitrilysin family protein [Liquorilactobacillus ghanensis]|uniref:EF-P 5-aminopentanol modification-associated protein YfmH n=1 Tax=Liquorilactobacillus ghanensis TaxID=399370 RepID=UPI0039E9321D
MKIIEYPLVNEKLYIQHLKNGLTIKILPRADFHKVYGSLRVEYGSLDNCFLTSDQQKKAFPAGIAHFLEHKMFDQPTGDAFEQFSHLGADANAFTTYTNTNYLFSGTTQIKQNVLALLDFVQQPYFQSAAVEREKKIIGQEIKMYQDDINWQLYAGVLAGMYPNHPLSDDIAGSLASIEQITAADLLACYQAFYRPEKMSFLLTGAVDPVEAVSWFENNQAQKKLPAYPAGQTRDITVAEQAAARSFKQVLLPTQRPKATLGLKGTDQVSVSNRSGLKYSLALELAFFMLFGEISDNYQKLYESGIIDDSFNFEIQVDRGFHFAVLSSECTEPATLFASLIKILQAGSQQLETAATEFSLAKHDLLGTQIQSLDSLENIISEDQGLLFDQATVLDQIDLLQQLSLTDVCRTFKSFWQNCQLSKFQILPEEGV